MPERTIPDRSLTGSLGVVWAMSKLSLSDSAVALRSFSRRFSEELAGPIDDDAWVRRLVARLDDGLSAIDTLQQATMRLDAFTTTLDKLPRVLNARSTTSFEWKRYDDLGPSPSKTFNALLSELKRAAVAAAAAVEARRNDDLDREVLIDGIPSTMGDYLDNVVEVTATEIRHLGNLLTA